MRKNLVKMLIVGLVTGLMVFFVGVYNPLFAVTQQEFTLTVLKDNNPVREFSGQVAIPFGTEYKLRLKNNNQRRCSATVYIDGAKVSEIGDFIIDPTDYLDLERFLNESLTEGKRFKFVPLSHPDVDDPAREENGIIKVEFRLEKLQQIMPKKWKEWDGTIHVDTETSSSIPDSGTFTLELTDTTFLLKTDTTDYSSTTILCSATSAGATVPGSYSNQSFYKVDFDGEDEMVSLSLKMVGIK